MQTITIVIPSKYKLYTARAGESFYLYHSNLFHPTQFDCRILVTDVFTPEDLESNYKHLELETVGIKCIFRSNTDIHFSSIQFNRVTVIIPKDYEVKNNTCFF